MKQRLTGASKTAAVITSLSLLFIASIVFSSITGETYAAAWVFSTYVYPSSIWQYSCADLHDVSLHSTDDQRFGAFSLRSEARLTPFQLAAKVSLERISDFLRETELLDEFDEAEKLITASPIKLVTTPSRATFFSWEPRDDSCQAGDVECELPRKDLSRQAVS